MRSGFKCKTELLEKLVDGLNVTVLNDLNGDFLESLKRFDSIAEKRLRPLLEGFYPNERSRDQAWRTCKGSLYEYAVFQYINSLIYKKKHLREGLTVFMGDYVLDEYRDQISIRNWNDIFPDVDILLIERRTNRVKAILSCKTSLRERLTETAFWKRELERKRDMQDIKIVFITADKDNELKTETNRYILLHVIDQTFITDPQRFDELILFFSSKYGDRKDFQELMNRVKLIDEMETFLIHLLNLSM